MTRFTRKILAGTALLLGVNGAALAQVSLTTLGVAHTQAFDTLPASGSATWTNNSTIPGWFHARTGTGTTIVANNGASNAGNLYSYGTGTATDRALGSLGSGNAAIGNLFWGLRLQNNTGTTITQLDISYTGEQWRNSAAAAQTIAFSYLIGSPTVTGSLAEFQSAGIAEPALNFTSPITGGVAAALDGNLAANRTAISFSITGLSIPNGTEVMLRWSDPDHTGADHGLSIDDFSVTPQGAAPVVPDLSISDVSLAEGNVGTTTFTFTVSLSAPAPVGGVTFDIATADGSATAPSDYTTNSLPSQTIPAGSSTYNFDVVVNGDTLFEFQEDFFVNVSNVVGANVVDGQGTGTIGMDDAEPTLTATVTPSSSITEGDAGTTAVDITYTLSGLAQDDLTIDLHTAHGTTDAADYNGFPMGDTVILPGGNLSTVYSDITINGDTDVEPNETFNVTVDNYFFGGGRRAPRGVVLPDTTVTIVNDDVLATYEFSIDDVSVTETDAAGVNAVFTVTLTDTTPPRNAHRGTLATVDFTTVAGSALAPDDFTTTAGTLSFGAPGTQTISVPIVGDLLDEATENFTVLLSNATVATIADDTGLGTINDNDAAPSLSINDVTLVEGNAGSTNATLTVTLSAASGQTVTVTATAADGSATAADNDYAATTVPLTFMPGQLTQSVNVPINGDTNVEPDETLFVNLSAVGNATIADGQGQITITNDDASSDLSATITDTPDPVLPGGTITYTVTLTNSGPNNADNAGFSLPLPTGTTFDSLNAPMGWNCTTPAMGANGTVSCSESVMPRAQQQSAAKMAPGSAVFTIVAAVDFAVPPGTVLTSTLSATTTTFDPNAANNTAPAATTVGTPPLVPPIPALDRLGQLLIALLVLGFAAMSLRRHGA